MKKIAIAIMVFVSVLTLVYLSGPKPDWPKPETVPMTLHVGIDSIESYIAKKERFYRIKPGLESQIVWADKPGKKTRLSVVYLSGLGAAWPEGDPIHRNFAKRFGANLYLPRLYDHGLALPPDSLFAELTPEKLMSSAREALAVGRILGDELIIIATSTGCTFAAYLSVYQKDIKTLILLSPNFGIDHRLGSDLLDGPWGVQIARFFLGSNKYSWRPTNQYDTLYWATSYRVEGLVALRSLIRSCVSKEIFSDIDIPVFIGYYPNDQIISVKAIERFLPAFSRATVRTYPRAGHHVIGSQLKSADWQNVERDIFLFAEQQLGLTPVY